MYRNQYLVEGEIGGVEENEGEASACSPCAVKKREIIETKSRNQEWIIASTALITKVSASTFKSQFDYN